MSYRAKHICEYVALRIVVGVLSLLPYRCALAVGWMIAALVFCVGRKSVHEACRRMQVAFGDRFTPAQRRHMAWISLRNLVFNFVEVLRIPHLTPRWFGRHFDCEEFMDAVRRCTDTGRGAIVACPHMGNWELAGIACHVCGIPIFNIAARQRNPLVNRYFNTIRSSPGVATVERGSGSMRSVLRKIKAGQALAILPDSRMRRPDIALPFLGHEANLGTGTAAFANHANVPIFLGIVTRTGWCRHHIRLRETIHPDTSLPRREDVRRMMVRAVKLCDEAIQSQPEQWFWFNKRWVLDPPEEENEEERSAGRSQ
jgi:KDO2-lipid IV(A) lauroyltransferase